MNSHILRTTILLFLPTFLFFEPLFAFQGVVTHPLSKHDSTVIRQYEKNHQEQLELGDRKEASRFLNEIALMYWNHSYYRKAIEYYEKSIGLNQGVGNENGIAMINNNLGMLYSDIQNYEKSLECFRKTLAARKVHQEKVGMISALINMAVVQNNLSENQEAANSLEEALKYARELNDPDQMKSCYGMLAETYTKMGKSEKAQEYFELYRTFFEHVQKEKIQEVRLREEEARLKAQLAEAEKRNKELELIAKKVELAETTEKLEVSDSMRYELLENLTRKQLELKVLEDEKIKKELEASLAEEKRVILDEQLKNATLTRNMFIGGSGFLLLLAFLIAYGYQRKRKDNQLLHQQNTEINHQKNQIETQKEQITQSINYAQRIQFAALDDPKKLDAFFIKSLVFFKPRDIVSGDFYWFKQVDDCLVLAAVDCTGHGVPGAFMSMLGIDLLNQIIIRQKITDPGKILDHLRDGIQETLKQEETENRDGMDIAICAYHPKKKELRYAGAKNPLILIQENELSVIKADRMGIGGSTPKKQLGKNFTTHSFSIDKPTCFYIFSDGFPDQFGGDKSTKFLIKNFRELLFQIHQLPAKEQHRQLESTLSGWQGNLHQTDDILVIGGCISPKN